MEDFAYLDHTDIEFIVDDGSSDHPLKGTGFYKVLIADDDEAIHGMTKLTLKDFEFNGKGLKFYDTYSGKETMEFLIENHDMAIVFLDVVMEEENSGLKVVEFLRNEIRNKNTRIVLRTGQPGKAPENQIIKNYDINDYKTKTEMTYEKMYTTVYSCLRSFRDIITIEKNKLGLEKIVKASSNIFQKKSFHDFLNGILEQLASLYDDEHIIFFKDEKNLDFTSKKKNSFIAQNKDRSYKIVAATGRFKEFVSANVDVIPNFDHVCTTIKELEHKSGENLILLPDHSYLAYHKGSMGTENYIYMESSSAHDELDLINVFLSNFSIAIDNYQLTHEMIDIQKEVIFILGELIEKRSEETASHVRRISETTHFLAKAAGCDEEFCENIRVASSLHDVGKISIPDSILKKNGKLNDDETAIMKTHSEMGYNLLKTSKQDIMKLSAEIALSHHERYDGTGYPHGLVGNDIPFSARLVAITDVFDALSHNRCYKPKWPEENVLQYFHENRGKHFDPELIDVFFNVYPEMKQVNSTYSS